MKYILDTHTHTYVSGHAYNTMKEMVQAASEKGLSLLAITEHGPAMPGTCHDFYFHNLKVVPRTMLGIKLLLGAEANIIDKTGKLDMNAYPLREMDLVIASLHAATIKPGSIKDNTDAVLGAIANPYVHIIGHPDDSRFPLDYEVIVRAAKEAGVLLELNNSSLSPYSFRENARENVLTYLKLCKQYGASITLGTDAHVDTAIGDFSFAKELLAEVDFPSELVVNDSVEKLLSFVNTRKAKCK